MNMKLLSSLIEIMFVFSSSWSLVKQKDGSSSFQINFSRPASHTLTVTMELKHWRREDNVDDVLVEALAKNNWNLSKNIRPIDNRNLN